MASRRYPQEPLSQKRAKAALTHLLYFCMEEQLVRFTASGLAASYNVPLATVEAMLDAARRARIP